ncbi:MAG: hydroxymethylpyrimidine/phosphomethylpyrimidine kinase [Crocinitomicaceae bacterium]|jgi:hydroxymethylpyrimidine/phosphomethylpyrimidine kinase
MNKRPHILTIAGYDPCGGAGVLADIKTAEFNQCMGMGVLTANTIQTEDTFVSVGWIEEKQIVKQLDTLFTRYQFGAVKIGIIESFERLQTIVNKVKEHQPTVFIVWDTVLSASSGFDFVNEINQEKLMTLLKSIDLITPNANEVHKLTGNGDVYQGAKELSLHTTILLKGGHRTDKIGVDTLFYNGIEIDFLPANTQVFPKHGSGCMLSSAIASNVALGFSIDVACEKAKRFIEKQLSINNSLLAYYV